VDLSSQSDGEFEEAAVLTGELPKGFENPILLTAGRIDGATLTGASLAGSRFVDVVMEGCELSGVDLEAASFTRVEVIGCRMSGARLAECRLRDVRFVDCRMDGMNLRLAKGEYVRFEKCRLEGAEFVEAVLVGTAWWDCDLTDADLSKISAPRAQLHGSKLGGMRGAESLVPVAIDNEQEAIFAAHLMATLGVAVTPRVDE
jgi:uncharacterized protein YjbI with pentapeptide repeats